MSPRTPARRSRPVADGLAARIIELRGLRVMLSPDLAALYGVEPRVLIQAVKRNRARFPADFMFHLGPGDLANLKSQIVTSSWGGSRTLPYAFTEQGVAMLSSVLRSPRAIAVNIEIMRAFVRLRAMTATADQLRDRLDDLERKYDGQFRQVFDAIRRLMEPSPSPPKRIGFTAVTDRRDPSARRRRRARAPAHASDLPARPSR